MVKYETHFSLARYAFVGRMTKIAILCYGGNVKKIRCETKNPFTITLALLVVCMDSGKPGTRTDTRKDWASPDWLATPAMERKRKKAQIPKGNSKKS